MILSNPRINRLFVILLITAFFSCNTMGKNVIYVSPLGKDDNLGNKRYPILTIEEAFHRVEKIRKDGYVNEIEIRLMAGTYSVLKTIDLNNSLYSNVRIVGAGSNKTFISSGRVVKRTIREEGDYRVIDLSDEDCCGNNIPQLFINGSRKVLARIPNENIYFVPGEYEWKAKTKNGGSGIVDFKIPVDAVEALQEVGNYNDVIVSFLHEWCETRRYVSDYNKDSRNLSIEDPISRTKQYFTRKGAKQFFFENDRSFIDEPGEYCYSPEEKCFYYMPEDYEDLNNSMIIVPENRTLFTIAGAREAPIQSLLFKGISFEYTKYTMSDEGEEPYQASNNAQAAVMLDYATGVYFENCEFCHLGEYAIWFREGCSDCSVKHSYLHDLGAGGIKIGVTRSPFPMDKEYLVSRNIEIDNNIIREGGRILYPSVGVLLLQASDCQVTHNDISDFYYTGVSVGWTWGYADNPAKRNNVSYNRIHHLGWGALDDMGGIYTLGVSEGTTIGNNVIHHLSSLGDKAWGIYLDEGSSDITVKGNVVYECKTSAFHLHYGKENRIKNNFFVVNNPINISKKENHISLIVEDNIVYQEPNGDFFDKTLESNIKSSGNKLLRAVNNTSQIKKVVKRKKVGVYGVNSWRKLAEANKKRELLFESFIQK